MANYLECGKCRWCNKKQTDRMGKHKCVQRGEYVSDKEVIRSCKDAEKYEESRGGFSRSGLWYITTLIFNLLGDNEYNTRTFLHVYSLKHNYLDVHPAYASFLKDYDVVGPIISETINNRTDKVQIAEDLFNRFLVPCADLVKIAEFDQAASVYINMVDELRTKFLPQPIAIQKPAILFDEKVRSLDADILMLMRLRPNIVENNEC